MSNYDFNPSILRFNLRREGLADKDYIKSIKFRKKTSESFEIALDLTIGGLNLIKDPILNNYVPFYLNVITYGKIGGRAINIHTLFSKKYNEPNLIYDDLTLMVGKFYNTDPLDADYNYIDTSIYIEILITENEIHTFESALEVVCSPNKNTIFKTKMPYSDIYAKSNM